MMTSYTAPLACLAATSDKLGSDAMGVPRGAHSMALSRTLLFPEQLALGGTMTNTIETLSIYCHQCTFKWTAPNTPKGRAYIANTGAGHTVLYPDHVVTSEAPDRG